MISKVGGEVNNDLRFTQIFFDFSAHGPPWPLEGRGKVLRFTATRQGAVSFNAWVAKLIFRGLYEMMSIHVFGNLMRLPCSELCNDLAVGSADDSSTCFGARPGARELTH
jgi:hypothetical protein